MKIVLLAALAVSLTLPAFAGGGQSGGPASPSNHAAKAATGTGAKTAHEHIGSYTKMDGTLVKEHDRSSKDGTK
ncbi:hypothetical protein [Janthinobacterium sp. BJB304]|uniref:hypothetical protein n=1 Tax=Janthinobacterium sp. BJB304 TaxID=1572871 RepID=UPI000C0E25B4|nr:hypothetical protein [Janthinobacterium sp. BJB304]PHV36000.1 hypothetical protein CSQ95_26715 [Janthinobacterium sp. BJB304]